MGKTLRFNKKLSFLKSLTTAIDADPFFFGIVSDEEAYSKE
jgi:hypothetical protein